MKAFSKKNILIYSFVVVIILGYTFFFTSNKTIPNKNKYSLTALSTDISYENRNFRIIRWDYSPEQQLMEVQLEIENNNLDGLDSYDFSSVIRPSGRTIITPIIEENDFIVIHIEHIPKKFKEISLRVKVKGSQNGEELRLYSNIDDISIVDNITEKTKDEYYIQRIEQNIEDYKAEIKNAESEIERLNDEIEQANLQISDKEESKRYQTEEEIQKTNNAIIAYENTISDLQNQINTQTENISELENKIAKSQEHIKDIQG